MSERSTLRVGDCRDVMAAMDADSIDAIVTDPPYGLSFMGRDWDHGVPGAHFWQEALRVAKPGAHMLAFGGARTFHRLTCSIEDAGWEIRDCIMWVYGSGFPKSLDVSKGMDKNAGRLGTSVVALKQRLIRLFDASGKTRGQIDLECGFSACNYLRLPADGKRPDPWVNVLPSQEKWQRIKTAIGCDGNVEVELELDHVFAEAVREVIGTDTKARSQAGKSALPTMGAEVKYETWEITAPSTGAAKQWDGWGTALKPAWEPIIVARKPPAGTVAENVQRFGTGAINVDGCRIETAPADSLAMERVNSPGSARNAPKTARQNDGKWDGPIGTGQMDTTRGRWPANLIHDGSAEVVELFPDARSSGYYDANESGNTGQRVTNFGGAGTPASMFADTGSAARFFYCAKASREDRNEGCEGMPLRNNMRVNAPREDEAEKTADNSRNHHPTVKPTDLMRYLCRLVTPPDGLILDPIHGQRVNRESGDA